MPVPHAHSLFSLTLAEEFALAEPGAALPDAATLAAEAQGAGARRASAEHLRARLAAFVAAVHAPTAGGEAQRACASVEQGDRLVLGIGHILRAAAELRRIERAMGDGLDARVEPLIERILQLLDRWDAEGPSLAFRRERQALRAAAEALALPARVEASLSTAREAVMLRRFGIDEHEDAPERIALGRALAVEARLLDLEVLLTRARTSPPALERLVAWALDEHLIDTPVEVILASTRQVSLHLAALRTDLCTLASGHPRGPTGAATSGWRLLRWAVGEGLIDEASEIVLLRAPLHTR